MNKLSSLRRAEALSLAQGQRANPNLSPCHCERSAAISTYPLYPSDLTNAIYFNAAWQYPFNENMTDNGAFHLLDGGEVNVPMMKQTESFGYAEGDGYQAVELPYDGRELSMVILLP